MSSKIKIIPYNSDLKELAKDLRKNMTLSEVLLWNKLKKKNMMGFDFDRQRPIDNFIVDFYCPDLMLAIEIDGSSHNDKIEYDEQRQKRLESFNVSILRFTDLEVKKNLAGVVDTIAYWIDDNMQLKIDSEN